MPTPSSSGPASRRSRQFLADFRAGRRRRATSRRRTGRSTACRRSAATSSSAVATSCPTRSSSRAAARSTATSATRTRSSPAAASFYTQRVDDALAEIERLPGRHLYFLDDHLLGDPRFAEAPVRGHARDGQAVPGRRHGRFGPARRPDRAGAEAGLRSLFVGFETFDARQPARAATKAEPGPRLRGGDRRLHDLGIMINGSFVFGMDDDDRMCFARTVDWAVAHGITTATFHIQTPYPGTRLYARMRAAGRIAHRNWDLYDTRHVVYRPARLSPRAFKEGYDCAYRDFYRWRIIARGAWRTARVEAQGQALLLRGRLEEIRAAVGCRDPGATAP